VIDEASLRIAVLADHLDEVDYYALLELARDASREAVRDGFHRFALRFHPDQHVGDPVNQRKALAIFKRGAEAYRVLLHPVLRGRYDEALATGVVRLPPSAQTLPPPSAPAVEVPPAARAFFDKAVEALARREFGSAKMHLALATARGESPRFEALAREIAAAEKRGR
jgi:curved DNA-binding protein CbpA